MRRSLLGVLLGLALTGPGALRAQQSVSVSPQPPPRDAAAPRTAVAATAVISGVVTSADTGTPLRRVNVSLQRAGPGPGMPPAYTPAHERSVITDDHGRFEFIGVAAGRWKVTASKAGYLTQQLGQRRVVESAPPFVLADGQRLEAHLALMRAAAINGRVYDEYGQPLAGARVQVMRPRMVRRQRYLQPVGEGDLSDDTGAFRLHSLPPGEYYVSASLRVAPLDSVVQTTYAPTYYPGTGDFADAQRVMVGAGAEVHADFPVLPVRTARITGFVQDSSGGPANAFLNLMSEAAELGAPLGVGAATRADGSFVLADVPPGNYTLYASLREGGIDGEVAALPLAVSGEDLSGIVLATAKPGSMRVTLAADAGVSRVMPTTVDLAGRSLRAGQETKYGVAGRVSSRPMTVPTGPFSLDADIPDGWALKALIVGDVDMTDVPIDLKGQQDVPVRMVLTDKVTAISGTVTVGGPGRAISVVVFPEAEARWRPPSRFVRTVAADERGGFRIAGLPGGLRYLAVAVEGLEEGEGDDPEFFERLRDHAISFPVAEGEQRVLGLAVQEGR